MDFALVVLLGVVQGITEFLPISSDGHLAIAEAAASELTGRHLPNALGLNIVLHTGTLGAILAIYGRRFWSLLRHDRRALALLIVGTLPAVVVGLPLHRWGKEFLTDPLLAGCLLPVTGLLLLWAGRRTPGDLDYQQMTFGQALTIGLFQAAAILPGISRSGTTISAALLLGLRREAAATFSFLLAIPAVGGACLLELLELATSPAEPDIPVSALVAGALVSLAVGLAALWWLLRWLEQGRLHLFAWWCLGLGAVVVLWQLSA